ncbi:MAG: hypothetical protein Q4G27_05605 [Flavobacteriaceae bacterium]|nr:hypothetical protein [Flavobacteriaceae bacterium]
MKNILFIAIIGIFSLSSSVQAQQVKGKKDKVEMLEKMKEKLQLSDNQISQIKAIDAKYEGRETEIVKKMSEIKEEHNALKTEKKAEIDKILTNEQREKIKIWREEHKNNFQKNKAEMRRK